ncbi:unnamed protein product (mitochondrion) [Plasmodiophora brassicae]|uniref:Uncharacterized protein n=1 Tax=Plasmodiophora brassicae TaxID=37360 RepID=A0A3P3YG83_PLABS|nr:unnamed protein product [Plasmodiophora brassicae]
MARWRCRRYSVNLFVRSRTRLAPLLTNIMEPAQQSSFTHRNLKWVLCAVALAIVGGIFITANLILISRKQAEKQAELDHLLDRMIEDIEAGELHSMGDIDEAISYVISGYNGLRPHPDSDWNQRFKRTCDRYNDVLLDHGFYDGFVHFRPRT